MAAFGIIELIALLLGLAGFGLQPNPKAPTPDQSLQYALADADVVAHFDAASVIPGNYKLLTQLPDQPQIKASAELSKLVRQAITEVEGGRGLAKGLTGIDFATDVSDATIFVQLVPNQQPSFVATVHGKLSTTIIDKIAKITHGQVTKVGAGSMVEATGDAPAVGITNDGVMIAGTPRLVRERLGDDWKTPPHGAGTSLGYAAEVLGGKPVFAVILTMSASARKEAIGSLGGQNFLTDVLERHKVASFAAFHDGVGWTWVDSTKAGLDSMAMISDGFIDLLRAAQIAPRGLAKIVLGGLESYRKTDKKIEDLLKHKADVLKIVDTFTGDGSFKVQTTKDLATLRLSVRATGKSLSEVLPLGFIGPGMIAGALLFRGEGAAPPPTLAEPPEKPRLSPRPVGPVPPQLPKKK